MADFVSKRKRSQIMAAVKSRGNKTTEGKLVSIFRRNKINGWRRNVSLFGSPDFVFFKDNFVVFVDGCFWHGCPRHLRKPKANKTYWQNKVFKNQKRDRLVMKTLRHMGWRVLRVWEHELKDESRLSVRLRKKLRWRHQSV
jgi:DNA mismatch endonuclease (patch repair protein)